MPRTVVTKEDVATATPTPPTPDSLITKVLKFIPTEIIGAYLFLDGITRSALGAPDDLMRLRLFLFAAVLVCFLATPLYLWRVMAVSKPVQIGVSMGAFIVWVFALGGPFSTFDWYRTFYGSFVLVIFTLFSSILNPGSSRT